MADRLYLLHNLEYHDGRRDIVQWQYDMQGLGLHVVHLPWARVSQLINSEETHELDAWPKQNTTAPWHEFNWFWWAFKSQDDAMMFRLRWQ